MTDLDRIEKYCIDKINELKMKEEDTTSAFKDLTRGGVMKGFADVLNHVRNLKQNRFNHAKAAK
jgi:hypothetical protein